MGRKRWRAARARDRLAWQRVDAILKRKQGLSVLRKSLHQNGAIVKWLLGLKHVPRKIALLYELMADYYANMSTTPRARDTPRCSAQFFPDAPTLRSQLLFRVFHQHKWPTELIEAMAILIGAPSSTPEEEPAISSEVKLLTFIRSNGGSSAKRHLLTNHVVIILALSYQCQEKKTSKGPNPLELLETQYLEQFLERPEEMLRRVAELYDYLYKNTPEEAHIFIEKIANSRSILKKALQLSLEKPPYNEDWWNVEVKDSFVTTLESLLKKLIEKNDSTIDFSAASH